ncbi:ABC transporter permease [Lichenihabitans psoromatis]|uniref:ABC transporter permease n=1 Tax=Lichenihabitans psoromatis TaxID=2528642 RepID=UPI0010383078|nr:ABC transporter permease [Lichenihabitans psoromatis]
MSNPPLAASSATQPRLSPLAYLVRFQSLLGLILVIVAGVIFSPRRHGHILFLGADNIANIIRSVSETGILALGMTFVIIAAGIDLSVGAVLGLCSVLTATLLVNEGWSLWTTLPLVIVTGTLFGAMQGAISTKFRIQAFIVTLAGLQAARGLSLIASNNAFININYGEGPGNAPPAFAILGERLGGVFPVATLVFLVLAVVAAFVLNNTRYGRYVFAIGGNEKAARLSGIPVNAIKISVYALTGFAAAIAGIVHAGQFSFGSPNDGTGYELNAIAAVVIGGTDLFGGAGSMIGTIAGAVMLGALANILQLNDVSAAMQLLATGAIIVIAAALQTYVVGRGATR